MTTRVVLIGPPLEASGGVGRVMSYVMPASAPENIEIKVLDTRGRSAHPMLSIFPLARSWLRLMWLGLTGRVDVAHINISSHGSTIRKATMSWTCRLLRIPTILHLHSGHYPEFFARSPLIGRAIMRRTFSSVDLVIVLGSVWQEFAAASCGCRLARC